MILEYMAQIYKQKAVFCYGMYWQGTGRSRNKGDDGTGLIARWITQGSLFRFQLYEISATI